MVKRAKTVACIRLAMLPKNMCATMNRNQDNRLLPRFSNNLWLVVPFTPHDPRAVWSLQNFVVCDLRSAAGGAVFTVRFCLIIAISENFWRFVAKEVFHQTILISCRDLSALVQRGQNGST